MKTQQEEVVVYCQCVQLKWTSHISLHSFVLIFFNHLKKFNFIRNSQYRDAAASGWLLPRTALPVHTCTTVSDPDNISMSQKCDTLSVINLKLYMIVKYIK